ncbi:MAG TPA: RNA polymerase sigma factor [Bryobacteraceae bacterium]
MTAFSDGAEHESQRIARALRRRDSEFIGRIVSQYHCRLLRYLVYWTSRREQAEDLVQETWLRVLEHAEQYDGRLRFEPWLFSIARNLAIDHLRKQQTATHRMCQENEPGVDPPAPDFESPFFAAARSEDAKRIAAALGALEPIYREALLLRFQEDLSLAEIAQVAGAPITTVSSRIYRGLSMLEAALGGGTDAA